MRAGGFARNGVHLEGIEPLVLPDADLDIVTGSLVWGAFANSGQICASIERAYVHGDLYERFVDRAVELTRTLRLGDPRTGEVDIGAMTVCMYTLREREFIVAARSYGASDSRIIFRYLVPRILPVLLAALEAIAFDEARHHPLAGNLDVTFSARLSHYQGRLLPELLLLDWGRP